VVASNMPQGKSNLNKGAVGKKTVANKHGKGERSTKRGAGLGLQHAEPSHMYVQLKLAKIGSVSMNSKLGFTAC
jgi:hypothetical protein